MSDPRNAAHDKKVAQEKKHQGEMPSTGAAAVVVAAEPDDPADPLSEVYSAQNAVQTKLTRLIEADKAECDRMQA